MEPVVTEKPVVVDGLMNCPECGQTMSRNGRQRGRQRYLCSGCGRQAIEPSSRSELGRPKSDRTCSICSEPHLKYGLCKEHFYLVINEKHLLTESVEFNAGIALYRSQQPEPPKQSTQWCGYAFACEVDKLRSSWISSL